MDPNATLQQLREQMANIPDSPQAELFDALDEWLSKGGFLPNDWKSFPNLVCDNSLIDAMNEKNRADWEEMEGTE